MAYAAVITAAITAFSAVSQAQSANKAAKYNAAVANNNAVVSRNAAEEEARRARRLGMKRMGTLRANGASLDLLEDSAREEELQVLTILHQGEVQAAGYGGTYSLNQARARSATNEGYAGAASALLNGVAAYNNAA